MYRDALPFRLERTLRSIATPVFQVVRALARAPIFASTVVLTLALGIGATAAVFSIIDAVLIRPLPYTEPNRLVVLRHSLLGIGIPEAGLSLGTFYEYRRASRTLAAIAAYTTAPVNLSDTNETADAERVAAAQVSASLLSTLGVAPARGRGFLPADEGRDVRVAIIGEDLWRRRFGGDPNILDGQVHINGDVYQVVGIMPSGFHFPEPATQIWQPLQLDSLATEAGGFSLAGIGRLAANAAVIVRPVRDALVATYARTLWVVAAAVLPLGTLHLRSQSSPFSHEAYGDPLSIRSACATMALRSPRCSAPKIS